MRVVIIEDEIPAAHRLEKLLQKVGVTGIAAKLDSVEASVKYLRAGRDIDLIFMDIQLADGLSFTIFEEIELKTPVIFTTAFDQYALKAFKVNSIDYLLKPIDEDELQKALTKFDSWGVKEQAAFPEKILKLIGDINTAKYKDRLLIKGAQHIGYLKTDDIACCHADGKYCFAVDMHGNSHLLEQNLTQLETQLHPRKFYRANRNLTVNIEAIKKVHLWFGGRLKVELAVRVNAETVVSRDRVAGFKEWLGGM